MAILTISVLLVSLKSPALVLGDLTYPGIDWDRLYAESTAERKVINTVQDFFWTQHIDFPNPQKSCIW